MVPGSGNQWHSKADVKTADWLIEVKNTAARSYRLKLDDLELIEKHALAAGKSPAFVVDFGGQSYYVIRAKDFNAG